MSKNIISTIENLQYKSPKLEFKTGDIICVNFKIIEKGLKSKNQNFEGLVISLKGSGINTTCTMRKISFGEGVEKTFFVNNPNVNWVKVKKIGKTKKSKIYYIRRLKSKIIK